VAVRKKTYILDTNVYLTDATSIFAFGKSDILVPLKVLEEIDKHKKRQDSVGLNSRNIIRILDSLREKGNLKKGVRIGKGKGIIYIKNCDTSLLPEELSSMDPDNMIIGTVLAERQNFPNKKIVVVSRDINMRIKCDSLEIPVQDYTVGQVVQNSALLHTGFTKHLVDDEVVDQFYEGEDIFLEKEEIRLYPNQMVMLVSNSNEKKTALARFLNYNSSLRKIIDKNDIWGVRSRNKEQKFALDLLLDPSVPVVTLVGKAGSGKTLCAIAAGLHQTVEDGQESTYRRLIVTRPIQPLGRDIGYLPGSMEEKMIPWLSPIKDNLEYLFGDKKMLDLYMNDGIIEIEALTYIRGRSISNAYIVIDECQQLTQHEIKTILTRVGENTKIVMTGDIEQIDNVYVDETSNGLTYVVEKFKDHDVAGHITLTRGRTFKSGNVGSKNIIEW
jgi:PhoH-like ATPase